MTVREINTLIRDAEATGKNCYAKGLVDPSLGLTLDSWLRIIRARTSERRIQARLLSWRWAHVIDGTIFDVR